MTREEIIELAKRFYRERLSTRRASQIATRDKILDDTLPPGEIDDLADIFPPYTVGMAYSVNDILVYHHHLYSVIQAHTSQADWPPDQVPALYKKHGATHPSGPCEGVADWVQPTGGHDAYNIGDRVCFEDQVWESTINANVWSPTAYPQGWSLVP